jgi:hypothetical protein
MNTKIKFLLVGFMAFIISLLLAQNAQAVSVMQDSTTITGIVTPVEWDEEESVIAVAITVTIEPEDSTEESYTEDYLVGDTEKGNELLQLIDEIVEATGTIETDEYGNKTIYVESYRVVKD